VKLLAVETSGFEGSIALVDDGQLVEERLLQTEGRRHAQTLVVEVNELLQQHGLASSRIDAVAVSVGPGSFTGLRVGVVFAKVFAWVNQAQLVAVDTLRAIAQRATAQPPVVTVISDAQRGEVFINRYVWDAGAAVRQPEGDIRIVAVTDLVAGLSDQQDVAVSGPGLEKFGNEFPDSNLLLDAGLWKPRASAVAEVGSQMLASGQVADIVTLEPFYLRRSYAEEKRKPHPGDVQRP
jgi:tRNA threonylcarbamoyladenosine biosynthesis protein TsaB